MKELQLGGQTVGLSHRPYFIADIAANHDGSLERALRLIELAKESGADAAKFQNFKAHTIVSRQGFYSMGGQLSHQKSWKKSVYEVYQEASISDDWTPALYDKCREVGITYMTSPYDFASVDWAAPYSDCFKVGSGDITWTGLLEHIAQKGKPVLLATGASSMEDVDRAMAVLAHHGNDVVLMQCNTNNTAEEENFEYINLNVLHTYQQRYPDAILGLSDHTHGHETVLGAIALGARVIEKHFTDDNSRTGPDHKFAMNPASWKAMVRSSLRLFYALGDGIKRIEKNERDTAVVQRRAIYFQKDLPAGAIIGHEDLFPLRPIQEGEIPPYEIDRLIGKALARPVQADTAVHWEDIVT